MKKNVYQIVTDKIIQMIESNQELVWRRTFQKYGLAKNLISQKEYQGINFLMLNFCAQHEIPYYLTFKQAKQLGGKVKKGAKSEMVLYYNVLFKDEKNQKLSKAEAQKRKEAGKPFQVLKYLKYYTVFNVSDVEGIDDEIPKLETYENNPIEQCEFIVNDMQNRPDIIHTNPQSAYYNRKDDFVNVPPIEQFTSSENYYSVLFHELAHATGHTSRLNRDTLNQISMFGDKDYSKEELVAELTASFLCAKAGINQAEIVENNAAYLKSWLGALKGNCKLILEAAAQAQKASDYILNENFME